MYRTNVQTAYNAGRAAEFTRNQPEYLEFVGIEDSRQTDICAERSGTILPASHPFWETNWPPLHFNCRSTVRSVYQAEVDALRDADPDWRPTADESLATVTPGKGFGGNPVASGSFWKMTPAMKERAEKYGLKTDIESFARSLGIKDYSLAAIAEQAPAVIPESIPVAAPSAQPAANAPVPQFKTIKEAEAYILDNNLADAVSFKGCDLRVVQEWTQNLRDDITRIPQARR